MTNIADSLKNHKSGKSSAESEGSPDEIFTVNNRKKPGQLSDNIGLQRYVVDEEIKYGLWYFRKPIALQGNVISRGGRERAEEGKHQKRKSQKVTR